MRPQLGGAVALALVALAAASAVVEPAAGAADPSGRRSITLGRSVDGRRIIAVESGDFDASQRVLVVGCIHGNETAGIAIAERLTDASPPPELDLWILPDLNPDGAAAATRGNAHGVDLNRNFPFRWRPLSWFVLFGPAGALGARKPARLPADPAAAAADRDLVPSAPAPGRRVRGATSRSSAGSRRSSAFHFSVSPATRVAPSAGRTMPSRARRRSWSSSVPGHRRAAAAARYARAVLQIAKTL